MSAILSVAICDDDREYGAFVSRMVFEYGRERELLLDVSHFDSSADLTRAIMDGLRYDVYILDIYMDGESGIALAGRLRLLDDDCAIFFLTFSRDHALEAFRLKAAHYLLKPVDRALFFSALDRCRETLPMRRSGEGEPLVTVRTPDALENITVRDILYVESLGRYQKIILTDHTVTAKNTLRALAKDLLPEGSFFTPHRAYIVNVRHVRKVTHDRIVMNNDDEIFFAQRKYKEVKSFFLASAFGQIVG